MKMLCDYQDITDIAGAPLWWDGQGVPRYAPFKPSMLGVYDRLALLVTIECQACGKHLSVGDGWSPYKSLYAGNPVTLTLAQFAERFNYGDPPWHGCRGAGESMSSIAVRIEEAWARHPLDWSRDHEVELTDVRPEWADE